VLVSLKPEFASAVAEGRKTVELRRRFPAVTAGVRLVIYATKPVGAVVGTAPIEAVQSASLDSIWRRHRGEVALTKARFDEYFASRSQGFAVLLGRFEALGPIESATVGAIIPGFRPPQSWMYVDAEALAALMKLAPNAPHQRRQR
jgi:predicted transcriptional regulator